MRSLHRQCRDRDIIVVAGTFVEGHDDVGPDGLLDLHRALRADVLAGAVERRSEPGTVVRHLDQTALAAVAPVRGGQTEELKAATIGEQRAAPAHEAVQATEGGKLLGSRTQAQVIGVGQDDLRPGLAEVARGQPS